jgi:atypical dual specificity phosphatase
MENTNTNSNYGLRLYKGNLTYVLSSDEAESIVDSKIRKAVPESAQINRRERDGESYHITIITKSELPISEDKVEILREKYDWSKFGVLGLGTTARNEAKAYYQIVWYPEATRLREMLKLPPKDFHITVGFEHSDVHDTSKDHNTLVRLSPLLVSSVEPTVANLTDEQRHQLIGLLLRYEAEFGESYDNQKLRMKIHFHLKEYDACIELLNMIKDPEDPTHILTSKAYVYLKMNQIYNAIHTLQEVPEEVRDDGWNQLMRDAAFRAAGRPDTRNRVHIQVWSEDIKLSRNFSWLIPLKVAGISIPKSADQIRAFDHANIGLIVTVMEEERLPEEWFEGTDIEYAYYAVENYGTPTIEEMDEILTKMEEIIRNEKAVLVHCGGGKGRAGTVLSCFVAKHGISGNLQEYPQMSASDAITYVREMRPGSVESTKQERFISDYVNYLYKRG